MNDLALIATASSALTAAVLLSFFHVYSRARRRQLARVREQRDIARAEARRLRADRVLPFAVHADRAVALTEPIPYVPTGKPVPYGLGAAPDPYAPVWTSGWIDGTHVHTEFGQVIRATRQGVH